MVCECLGVYTAGNDIQNYQYTHRGGAAEIERMGYTCITSGAEFVKWSIRGLDTAALV